MEALATLQKDKKLSKVVEIVPIITLPPSKKNLHLQLCYAVIGQQLSTIAAASIRNRFEQLLKKVGNTPEAILSIDEATLRAIGCSTTKAKYLHNIAQFFHDRQLTDARLRKMESEEIIELLSEIKGVGRWTVEMLLIFSMQRADVFAIDDLGIQKAMKELYNLEDSKKSSFYTHMQKIADKWRPHRTYACLYLWKRYEQMKLNASLARRK